MSDDTTDRELPTAPKDTAPILERILDELRALRENVARVETKLDRALVEIRTDLSRTRNVAREELSLESKDLSERMAALERRMDAIDGQGRQQ
jgi:hypothetical protein